MAWIDDRLWCHPKVVPLSDKAFRCYVNGLAYSSGFGMGGVLMPAHQTTIGATAKLRAELIVAGLWDELEEDGTAVVHDWKEHNEKRDARRAADRERKRAARAADKSADNGADNHADVHTLKVVKEVTDDLPKAVSPLKDGTAEVAS